MLKNKYKELGINEKIVDLSLAAEEAIKGSFSEIEEIASYNQLKVLKAMQNHRLADQHFNWNTGYGYDDAGRETIEAIFADIFGCEDAIVRPLIVNGTHALTLSITGILRPGDEMLSITGKPYDTLEEVVGISNKHNSSLKAFNIDYKQVELSDQGHFNFEEIEQTIKENTKLIYIQRSGGYSWRSALSVKDIEKAINHVKHIKPDVIVMVDNCYGEFLDYNEPTDVGADIMAGSLIKNPGGGLALSGGYIVGRTDLIEMISFRMTSPGIGKECGLMFGQSRSMLQGLFMAPQVVSGALKGAIFCSQLFNNLGYDVSPKPNGLRSDIIQAIKFGTAEKVIAFCQGIQSAAPVDSYVSPVPWDMPGYDSEVIMAAGAFVQGSSIELSADAPIKEPYIAYFQGGLTYDHSKFGAMKAAQQLYDKDLLKL